MRYLFSSLCLILIIHNLAAQYPRTTNVDSLILLFESSDSTHIKLEIIKRICQYSINNNNDLSRRYAYKYDSIAQITQNHSHLGQAYLLIGTSDFYDADYEAATENFILAQKEFSKIKKYSSVGSTYTNLGAIYDRTGQKDKLLESVQNAMKYYRLANDEKRVALCYMNIANLYSGQKQYDSTRIYREKAIQYFEKKPFGFYLCDAYATQASLFEKIKNYDLAKLYAQKAMVCTPTNGDIRARVYTALMHTAIETGQIRQSKIYMDSLEKLAFKHGIQIHIENWEDFSIAYYKKLGNYKKALEVQDTAFERRDSIKSTNDKKKINDLIESYNAEKKEQELLLLSSESKLVKNQLASSRRLSFTLGAGFLIVLGLLYWLYNTSKKLRKTNQEKDTLLKEIHHRVKNNLQVISALLSLQSRYIKDDTAINALKQGYDRVESMALIHRDLYQHDNLKGVNTKAYLEQLIENLTESYNISEDSIALTLDIDDIWLDVDTMIPMGLMINELISNALKHAFAECKEATLTIKLKDKGDHLQLYIADNGKGVDDIQSMQETSFGYSLIDSFAKKLKADITYQSNEGFAIDMKIRNFQKAA